MVGSNFTVRPMKQPFNLRRMFHKPWIKLGSFPDVVFDFHFNLLVFLSWMMPYSVIDGTVGRNDERDTYAIGSAIYYSGMKNQMTWVEETVSLGNSPLLFKLLYYLDGFNPFL
jgi:hypothetical protein